MNQWQQRRRLIGNVGLSATPTSGECRCDSSELRETLNTKVVPCLLEINRPLPLPPQFGFLFQGQPNGGVQPWPPVHWPWPPPGPVAPPALPDFRTANYTFSLLSMRITNTRSAHEDSDKASVSIAVGNGNPVTVTGNLGDLNNGTFPLHLAVGPVMVNDPDVGIAANYLIVNSGHQSQATIDAVLTKAGNELASDGAKWATSTIGSAVGLSIGSGVLPVIGSVLGAVAGWLVGEIIGILTADCDGPVAAEQPVFKGIDLWNRTQVPGTSFQHTTYHPGIDSNHGCGSNSEYYVTWQVHRTPHRRSQKSS